MPKVIYEMGGVSADGYIVGPAARQPVTGKEIMAHISTTTAADGTQ